MFGHMIDDLKDSTGTALRQTSLAAVAAVALFVTLSFLCAAAFVYVLRQYGLIEACLTGAGIFLLASLIAIGTYMMRRSRGGRRARETAKETAKSAVQTALADPMLVAAGLQVIRAIGVRKLVPILALGGLALGMLANRGHSTSVDEAPAE